MTYAQPQADPTSVVGRRIGAYAIDSLLIGLLFFAAIYPLFMSASTEIPSEGVTCSSSTFENNSPSSPSDREIDSPFCFQIGDSVRYIPKDDSGAFTGQFYGIGFGLAALNLVVVQGLTGASIGKLLLGLRVIRQDGSKAGIGWAALRWVLLYVDGFCCFLPGLILVFTTKGHRRLGDMAASSFVVRKEAVGTPPQVPGITAAAWPMPNQGFQPQGQAWGTGQGTPGTGWSPPGQGGAWPPTSPPASASASTGDPSAMPGADAPTWDAARNAYIQYDHDLAAWMQWSDATNSWQPIDQ